MIKISHLYTDEGDIDTTANHPFYVIGKGWVAAGDLVAGDEVYNLDGSTSIITGYEVEKLDEPVLVYNLEVEDFHSYFVGCVPVLVHNYEPSQNTRVFSTEKKAGYQIKKSEAVDFWDDFLGPNQNNINPLTGNPDKDRIFSADGKRSIRFGQHESGSYNTKKAHFHAEEWKYDYVNDIMYVNNTLIRMKK